MHRRGLYRKLVLSLPAIVGALLTQPHAGAPDGVAPGGDPPSDTVLARIGSETITSDDFRAEVERRSRTTPGIVSTPERQRMLLDEMVRHRAMLARARALGYDRHPDVLAVAERMAVEIYRREHVRNRVTEVTVSDAEVADHYAAHAADYAKPERFQAAVVFFAVHAKAAAEKRAEVEARAREALAAARELDPSTHHFGDVARTYSDDRASRYTGGVVGWLTRRDAPRGRLEPEVIQALMALEEPGEIAPLVTTPRGIYLVRLADRQDGAPQPLEALDDGIRQRLLRDKQAAVSDAFYTELYAQVDVEINAGALVDFGDDFEIPTPTPPALPGKP